MMCRYASWSPARTGENVQKWSIIINLHGRWGGSLSLTGLINYIWVAFLEKYWVWWVARIFESCTYTFLWFVLQAEVNVKIKKAYCPPKIVEGNPCLEYIKYIIFPWFNEFRVERNADNGGDKLVVPYLFTYIPA